MLDNLFGSYGDALQRTSQRHKIITPPKFNIVPEKWWLEDYFPIGKVTFEGLCHVKLREGKRNLSQS